MVRALQERGEPVGIPARATLDLPAQAAPAPARPVAIAWRRHLAASGPMPPGLAERFTTSELAVLRIVGDEVREKGCCGRTLAELAARAGCGRTKDAGSRRGSACASL